MTTEVWVAAVAGGQEKMGGGCCIRFSLDIQAIETKGFSILFLILSVRQRSLCQEISSQIPRRLSFTPSRGRQDPADRIHVAL